MNTLRKSIVILMSAVILLLTPGCARETSHEDLAVEEQSTKNTQEMEKESYIIAKTDNTPDWGSVPALQIDNVLWTDDFGIRAQGQLCYSDEALFVHLSAVEEDVRAENTEPLSPVYEDSCLEFFFTVGDTQNYFNFEINPNGCLCTQFGPSKADRIDIVRSDVEEYFEIHTNRTTDSWEVFYRIPLQFIRLFYPDYQFTGELAANFYKCGNKTTNKHYLSWSPIDLPSPNFHCPEFFGVLTFGQSEKGTKQ